MKKGKRKKRKENFYVVTISDNPKSLTRAFRVTQGSRHFWEIVISALIVVLIVFVALLNYRNSVLISRENVYKTTVDDLQAEIDSLQKENSTLNEKIAILSDTVKEKNEVVSAIEEKSVPSAFPLSVAADIEDTTVQTEIDGQKTDSPAIRFEAKNGTYVLAPGNGVVSRVYEVADDNWDIEIDHGNGYVTYYTVSGKPKVKVGDEVSKGGPLCELNSEDKSPELIYRISYENGFIDPKELLEING